MLLVTFHRALKDSFRFGYATLNKKLDFYRKHSKKILKHRKGSFLNETSDNKNKLPTRKSTSNQTYLALTLNLIDSDNPALKGHKLIMLFF